MDLAHAQIVHIWNLNTLEKLRDCLLNVYPKININNELIIKAKKPLNLMLKLS